ncbi:hypothetical protein CDL15_Pgr002609 [Punica granatum]|uniref:non-specific serine/threonine protein kinase n=1 Tax=Punica granatum TaxID=22663 RepID=A0A218WQH3_PUNGR|nr:hypothetical protein CDL15_Pgr002609 [Punica granatum]PKI52672.1 hypothetical protein CRG98_026932 [Punica granatum]
MKKKMKRPSPSCSCSISLLLLYSSLIFLSSSLSVAFPVQLNDDVLGLIVFKSDLVDPSSSLESWSEDDDFPCSWPFVLCEPSTSRVTELHLDGLGLSGKIGRGLQKLQHLKVLSLSGNNFTGTSISPGLTLPSNLQRLNLSNNGLSGRIPTSLINMSSIAFIDLSGNSFSGPLPDDFFTGCLSLRYISLADNMLEGPIPSTLSSCSLVNNLDFSNNRFTGIPNFASGFWTMQRLRVLDLANNRLSGSVPSGVPALHNLKQLILKGNQFSGPLPADLGLCPHLCVLDFSNNLFTGELPESIQRLNFLTSLSFSSNLLTGDFPDWIGNMTSLESIEFSRNRFTGSLATSMANLQALKLLSISENGITGSIPSSLVSCSKLSVIRLRRNSLTGQIPENLFNLGLEEVDISNNALVGSIPAGASKFLYSLQILDLSGNNLTGVIPEEMGLFSSLRYLNLSWNKLHSKIPSEFGYFQNLTILDLRNNGFYGSIPGDICNSGSMGILQLDGNSFTGPIPEEIGNCSSLYLLSLSHNHLSGPIPNSLSTLSNLRILKLEFNELIGEIPQSLGKLENLLAVNMSYNRLIGRLPTGGIFPSLDESALQGNLGICSPLLSGPCQMNVPKPLVLDPYAYGNQIDGHKDRDGESSSSSLHHHVFLSVSAIVAISAALLIACGVIAITVLNASARRRLAFVNAALESMCSSSSRSGSLASGRLIMFDSKSASHESISNPQALLNKASEIGEGVFGTVYKVPLGVQGRIVAIKRLITSTLTQYQEDFDREVRVLGKARHPNLISLRGYYWTPQQQLLVTDYTPNGSLQSKLHERLPSTPPLSWAVRFKIIVGTAKGLSHLHHSIRPPIIHYNLKPSNILLDENFNPKIADFGLARLLTKLDRHVMSNRFQSAPGYVAPELACQSLRVNEKCDVYGFGILILELVMGRRPVEYGEDNVVILCDHVRALLEQGNVLDSVDLSMGEYPEDEVLPVLKLALVCTSQIPSSRPSMAEVVQILQVIRTPVPHRMDAF